MKQNIVIFGVSQFSRLMHRYLQTDGRYEVKAFCVEPEYYCEERFLNLPVVTIRQLFENYPPELYDILLSMGTTRMGDVRERLFRQFRENGYSLMNYIHPSAIIQSDEIGEGNIILEHVVTQPFSRIGNGNLIWYQASVAHDTQIGDFNTICGGCSLSGFDIVGSHCFLGNNSTVRDHVRIGDYTLVGAGAYISKDTECRSVHVPARSVCLNRDSREFRV